MKWTIGNPIIDSQTPVSVSGVLIGTSTFDATTGNFYAKVSAPNSAGSNGSQLKFNVLDNTSTLSSTATFANSGSEVDMQSGLIYSYERSGTQYYMNRYNPVTNVSTNIGFFNFPPVVYFFPDSNCYDTNNKKYYFLITENISAIKLVTVNVGVSPIVTTIAPLTLPLNLVGNIGLEFNNTTNQIIANYGIAGTAGIPAAITIGKINTFLNTIESVATISGIQNFALGARTFDQNTQSLLFRSNYLPPNSGSSNLLVKFSTVTNTAEMFTMPLSLIEFEADNYEFSIMRYGLLNNQLVVKSGLAVFPNPTGDVINFSESVSNISISDISGKIVYQNDKQSVLDISLSNLDRGIYFLSYELENIKYSKKIAKN